MSTEMRNLMRRLHYSLSIAFTLKKYSERWVGRKPT